MAPPTALRLTLFATADCKWRDIRDPYVQVANDHLRPHGLVLDLFPEDAGSQPIMLNPQGALMIQDDYLRVRNLAHQALPNGDGRVPVIFCCMNGENGGTVPPGTGGSTWLPFVLLNTDNHTWHEETLLHELVHAAGYAGTAGDHTHDTDGGSVMFWADPLRPGYVGPVLPRALTTKHATALRTSYFAGLNTRKLS